AAHQQRVDLPSKKASLGRKALRVLRHHAFLLISAIASSRARLSSDMASCEPPGLSGCRSEVRRRYLASTAPSVVGPSAPAISSTSRQGRLLSGAGRAAKPLKVARTMLRPP